jgi:hypothetical protein
VKAVRLVAVPPLVVTAIFPVLAFAGTVAAIARDEITWNFAVVPPNVTDVAPLRFVPPIRIFVPRSAADGATIEIFGAEICAAARADPADKAAAAANVARLTPM